MGVPNLIICAFYVGHHYDICAKYLKDDCERLGYEYDISSPPSLHNFIKNRVYGVDYRNWVCRYKPVFIMEMLNKHKRPVLYLDVDSRVRSVMKPGCFRGVDIGISHEPHDLDAQIFNAIASCLYFNSLRKPDSQVVNFLKVWDRKCKLIPKNTADHWFLKTTLVDFIDSYRIAINYLDVERPFASRRGCEEPVVIHNARKYRREYKKWE